MKHFYAQKFRVGVLALMLILPFVVRAQVNLYTFSQLSGVYTPITGGTTLGSATNDDTSFPNNPIGFTFNYNNAAYTSFSVNSNGFIALGTTVNSSYTAISTGSTNNIIAGLNFDLQGKTTTGNLRYETIGTAPNRILVVQWTSYAAWSSTTNAADEFNFQIRLYETTDVVEVMYGTFAKNATNRTAQVGLRGNANTDFNNRTSTTSWAATTAGPFNNSTVSLTTTVTPASGLTFRWTPPPPTPMAYVSSTCAQPNVTNVQKNTINNEIIRIQINTTGSMTPFAATSFTINSNGTTNFTTDVSNVKIFYTGSSATFATTTLFGSATSLASPITGSQTLGVGANYFWVAYDIPATATINNLVDAECTSITMSGAGGTQTPTITAPAGSRRIFYCNSNAISTADDDIGNVTFGPLNNGNPNPSLSNPTSVNTYSNFTTLPVQTYFKTVNYPISISQINSSSFFYSTWVSVYIDYNQDGTFSTTTERVFNGPINTAGVPLTGNVTIPATALTGNTFMRVVMIETTVNTNQPCNTYTWGETEDYRIDIQDLPPIDAGAVMLTSPLAGNCYTPSETVEVQIKNFGTDTIDMTVNPVTVNASVTGPNPATFAPVTINTGQLLVGQTMNVIVSTNYNMSVAGTYVFSATAAAAGDGFAGNNAMPNDTIISNAPSVVASANTIVCENDSVGISVTATAIGNGPVITPSNMNPMPIPDTNPLGDTSNVIVANGPASASAAVISVTIDSLAHTFVSQLALTLIAPNGSFVDLSSANGGAGDNYINTTFIPSAATNITAGTAPFTGNFIPEQPFTNLTGSATGTWKLRVTDGTQGDIGTLYGWTLTMYSGNAIVSYSWSPSAGLSSDTIASPMASPATTTTYYVTATDVAGCTNTDSVTVTVNPAPVVNLGANTGFCQGGSMLLDAGAGYIWYTWQDSTNNQTLNVDSTGIYYVEVMDGNMCVGSDTIAITEFNPQVNLGADTAICMNDTLLLNAGAGFTSYTWSTTASTQVISVASPNTYYVDIVDPNGCPASDTIVVAVNALPVVNLGADSSICQGSNMVLDAGSGFTYLWSDSSVTQLLTVNAPGTYYVDITDVNGCMNNDTVNVTMDPTPVVNIGPDSIQCGGSIMLDAGNPGMAYMWSNTDLTQTTTVTSSNTYYVDVTNQFGCVGSDTVMITINPVPVAFAGNDTTICSSSSVTLNGGPGYSSYAWQSGSFNASSQMVTVSPGVTTTYGLTVVDANGCGSSTDFVTINVEPLPNASFSYTSTGTSVTFTNSSVGNLNVTYSWNFGDMTAPSSAVNPTHNYAGNGYYTVTLVVTTDCGSDTTTRYVPITVGVDEVQSLGSLQVFPNPSEGSFTIAIQDADYEQLSIEVIDLQGKVVYGMLEKNLSGQYTKQLDLNGVAKGMYYLRLSTGKQSSTKKLIIQ
jgi:subtilisin-like proprotein convertase family protein